MHIGYTNLCSSIVNFRFSIGTNYHSVMLKNEVKHVKSCLGFSHKCQTTNVKFLLPKNDKCNIGPLSRSQGRVSTGLFFGLLICYSTYEPIKAESAQQEDYKSHGKQVFNDYSITGIPGDGRCLFRSVAHGACLRSGKSAPNESLQRELADDLRARVADEFVTRRKETEWFVEGDFDTYISNIRKPHVWGGEPELFMASHVLKMPITVYMYDKDCSGLISIAEYGEEYGKDNPIRVLYHGFGHYDSLQIRCNKETTKSRL